MHSLKLSRGSKWLAEEDRQLGATADNRPFVLVANGSQVWGGHAGSGPSTQVRMPLPARRGRRHGRLSGRRGSGGASSRRSRGVDEIRHQQQEGFASNRIARRKRQHFGQSA